MSPKKQKEKTLENDDTNLNADFQGVDKDPEEEKGKAEEVTTNDLKDKTVDADPEEDIKKQQLYTNSIKT